MASGFETRTGGRDSFASQGPGIERIGRGIPDGEHRGAQLVGGGAVAGGAPNAQVTGPGNFTANLGKFLEDAMEPYVQRREREQFFQGLTRAQAGESIDELTKSRKGVVGSLFGPTSLAQGAQFYEGMRKVDQWSIDITNQMDELVKLSPPEQAKHLAETSMHLMGDDPYINDLVQKQLIEKTGPMLDVINKKRYIYLQDTARKGMFESFATAGQSLQQIASHIVDVNDLTDEETASVTVARNNFLGMMQKPEGMSDDTYRDTLTASMEGFAQRGDWYAYTALEAAGVMDVLQDEDKEKVLKAYDRYKSKALDDAKGNYIEELLSIQEGMEKRELSPLEAVARVDRINAAISRDTGLRERAYDSGYLSQTGKTVIDMIGADMRRDEERGYQERVRANERALDRQDEEREAAQGYSTALSLVQMGAPRSADASGVKADDLKKVYFNLYKSGDWATLGRAFDREHYFDSSVAKIAQAKMVTAGGVTYTGEAQQGYAEWQSMMKVSPGMAAYVYADQHPRMLLMQRLINGKVAPEIAYQRAFADLKGDRPKAILRPTDRKETMAAVAASVDKQDSSWFGYHLGFSNRPMGSQAKSLLTNVITEQVADMQRNSDLTPQALTKQAAQAASASGAFEYYGGNMAFRGDGSKTRASKVVGVTDKEFGEVLYSEIDQRFKDTGRRDGADMDYEIIRVPTQGGGFVLTVNPTDPDNGSPVIITSGELKSRVTNKVRGDLKQPTKPNNKDGVGFGVDTPSVKITMPTKPLFGNVRPKAPEFGKDPGAIKGNNTPGYKTLAKIHVDRSKDQRPGETLQEWQHRIGADSMNAWGLTKPHDFGKGKKRK